MKCHVSAKYRCRVPGLRDDRRNRQILHRSNYERISQPAVDGCDGLATVTVSGADVEVVQAMASARPRRTLTPIQRLGLISVLGRL